MATVKNLLMGSGAIVWVPSIFEVSLVEARRWNIAWKGPQIVAGVKFYVCGCNPPTIVSCNCKPSAYWHRPLSISFWDIHLHRL